MRSALFLVLLVSLISCRQDTKEAVSYIEVPANLNSGESDLLLTPHGDLYLSWIETDDSGLSHLLLSEYINETWQEPVTIASGDNWFVNWADFPSVQDWGEQGLVAHYLEKSAEDTYAYDVKVRMSKDRGRIWSEVITPHDDGTHTEHGFVSKLELTENEFLLAWLDGRQNEYAEQDSTLQKQMTLRSAIIDPSGLKQSDLLIDERVCDCCQTAMAMTSNGPIIVYRDRSETEIRDIYYSRFIDGKWTEPKAIYDDNWEIPGCPVNGPAVASNGKNIAVAWFSVNNDMAEVKIAFSENDGESFDLPIRVDYTKPLGRVDLLWLNEREVLLSWMDATADETSIMLQRLTQDGDKSNVFKVTSTSAERSSGFPRMVRLDDYVFITWTDIQDQTSIKVAKIDIESIR
ncbi:MAG: exo-alpha-sialidase [Bacteroidia bacterium]|nr:exo-alpha-sialidase [Bacteroidia bacterium]MBT8269293.1 exo-alpha-sialidase [Bacteroidia bacterium]